ncbi:hypothetical protein LTR94_035135, partial [Friedmanniomyces endolithicus]
MIQDRALALQQVGEQGALLRTLHLQQFGVGGGENLPRPIGRDLALEQGGEARHVHRIVEGGDGRGALAGPVRRLVATFVDRTQIVDGTQAARLQQGLVMGGEVRQFG